MSIFAGTTIATAGIESLSTIAERTASQICNKHAGSVLLEDSIIEIFDNGSVREVLQISLYHGTTMVVEFVDGILIKFGQTFENGFHADYPNPALFLQIWANDFELDEIHANLKFDQQAIDAQIWDQKQEEIDYLYHMMWDTDNYDFPPAAWERLANLEK
jgi:hypothetical protein